MIVRVRASVSHDYNYRVLGGTSDEFIILAKQPSRWCNFTDIGRPTVLHGPWTYAYISRLCHHAENHWTYRVLPFGKYVPRFDFRVQKDHPAARIRMCLVSGHRHSDERRKDDTQFAQMGSGKTAERHIGGIQTNKIAQRADKDPIYFTLSFIIQKTWKGNKIKKIHQGLRWRLIGKK